MPVKVKYPKLVAEMFPHFEGKYIRLHRFPATKFDLRIGYYGSANQLPLSYSVALVNGLNAASFEHGSVIREGRFEGRNASANNLAITLSLFRCFYKMTSKL